jgi:hypothetical protein
MDCETVRYRIEADPAHLDKDCAEHIEGCAACTAYFDRVRNTEWLIHEALRFDVAAMKRDAARKSMVRWTIVRRRTVWSGVAAMFVAGVALWFGVNVGPAVGTDPLLAEVTNHWYEEPESWVRTDVQISPASLAEVVSGRPEIDIGRLGLLSYAQSCFVRGEWVPHLVMQGERGPVMLLLLPHERVDEPLTLTLPDEGLSGVIVPLGEGSIAVIAEDGEPMAPIREQLGAAVEWSI